MFTVGTGVGGGIVIDGRIYRGATSSAAEFGHIDPLRRPDRRRAEARGLPAAGLDRARGRRRRAGRARRRARARRRPRRRRGGRARRQRRRSSACGSSASASGSAIANAINTFDPELVVIGGGVSAAGEFLLRPARQVAQEFTMRGLGSKTEIRIARYGPDAGVRGAALLAADRGGCGADEVRLRLRPRRCPASRDGDHGAAVGRARAARPRHGRRLPRRRAARSAAPCIERRGRARRDRLRQRRRRLGRRAASPGHPRDGRPRPLHGRASASATTTATCSASARASSGPAYRRRARPGVRRRARSPARSATCGGLARSTRSSATDFRQISKGADMATEATVNERLAAITAAGTSVWLDQIRRSMTQGGELRAARRRGLAARARPPTPRSSRRRSSAPRTTTSRSSELAHEGADARAIYQAIAIQDVQDAGRRAARRLRRDRRLRRLRLARGRPRPRVRHASARWSRRASTGAASTAPT